MKINKIVIKTIPQKQQRYWTVGDYKDPKNGVLTIMVSKFDNPDYGFLVGLHELCEAYLAFKHGLKDRDITAFDVEHPELDDPGSSKDAPYHKEHELATEIEALMSVALRVKWPEYDKACRKLTK